MLTYSYNIIYQPSTTNRTTNRSNHRRKDHAMYTEKKRKWLRIGRRIMFRREELGMTTGDLAASVDRAYSFIRDVEYGCRGISIDTLMEISQVLKVPADYLLFNTNKYFLEDDEISEKRQRIADYLCDCSAKELECVEKILHVVVDTMRERRSKVKNV